VGGRQLGRSEPAFRVASTTALPPPTCTARQDAGQLHRLAVLLQGLCRPDRLPAVYSKACAGRIVCRLCLPATALFAMPCLLPKFIHFASFCSAFPRPLFINMCARIVVQVAGTALLAATTRACSGGPCTGVDFWFFFSLQSP